MDLSWLQGWSLHSLVLKNMDLEKHFQYWLFPEMTVTDIGSGLAEYRHGPGDIRFMEKKMNYFLDAFQHIFFHELAHSTTKYTNRWYDRIAWSSSSFEDKIHIEERIADCAAFVLCSAFIRGIRNKDMAPELKYRITKTYETDLALPWGEVEAAVKCYLVNKDCPKVESALQYYKTIVSECTTVYEGMFDGRIHQPCKTETTPISSRYA